MMKGGCYPHPTQLGPSFTIDSKDVVAVFLGLVLGFEGQTVSTQPELGYTIVAVEVGITLGRVGEEAEIEGTHEVVVEDSIILLLGGYWLWCRRGSGEGWRE